MTDREKLFNLLMDELPDPSPWDGEIRLLLERLLANGVVVREKGEWATEEEIVYRYGSFTKRRYCTGCGESPKFDRETGKYILTNFCPNCGADMRKGEKG